ncbi:MAG: anhydro-N-acetylmuramic acid kinase [Bacteroidetes bacterium]|nr:anhydro-N-acetylmuramic acid kinase [Bacteroidota bacterium]
MIYRAIGIMSGSSTDGLDIVHAQFEENQGSWNFEIQHAECLTYNSFWKDTLRNAETLSSKEFFQVNFEYGKFIAGILQDFIEKNELHFKTQLIGFHGHTVFHNPSKGISVQLGDAAIIAADTGINTISNLRNLDIALGGQGAPIVPMGEKLLFPAYDFFLNIGGIANLSYHNKEDHSVIAFDICPANRILDILASRTGKTFDEKGKTARVGNVNEALLTALNALEYYHREPPKSLSNQFGTETILNLINNYNISSEDKLRTYTEHVCEQIVASLKTCTHELAHKNIFVSGGGAYNLFLIETLRVKLLALEIELVIPDAMIIEYKEALIMAFLAILRWREESTTLPSVTGASRAGIGGACWIGQQA